MQIFSLKRIVIAKIHLRNLKVIFIFNTIKLGKKQCQTFFLFRNNIYLIKLALIHQLNISLQF